MVALACMAKRSRVALEQSQRIPRGEQDSDTILFEYVGWGAGTKCYDRERGTRSFEFASQQAHSKTAVDIEAACSSHYELVAVF